MEKKSTVEGYFRIIVPRKNEIIKNKPIDYKSLIAQGKVLEIKKVHVADIMISEKGIEGLTNINSQKHSVKLLEILEEFKKKEKLGFMGPSESGLGPAYTEIDYTHKLYKWAVRDTLIYRNYMAEIL